ncbi:MAG: hypothetical protein IT379_29695, partial [Deltaproteobacteria bacterium]|nr:hypothetical protein [Deltaproteobacteria bacterium]
MDRAELGVRRWIARSSACGARGDARAPPVPSAAMPPSADSPDVAARRELDALAAQIRHHEDLYRRGVPEIPDAAFDDLVDRYAELADELGVATDERVDAKPGADHTEGFVTVEHRVPMLSLEKMSPAKRDSDGTPTPLLDQLVAWHDRRVADLELPSDTSLPLVVEPKVDGISVSVLYEHGKLKRAVTRGDGRKGDDITRQVRAAGAIPTTVRHAGNGSFEARGELYWPRDAFERHNAALIGAGEEPIANPRNGCAGMMKRKDPTGLGDAGILAFLYQVPWAEGVALPGTQHEVLAWLADIGAPVYLDEVFVATTPRAAFDYCVRYGERRATLPFDIDGMVLKLDELSRYAQLEGTSHHPHWGIAYKFPPERRATKVREIVVSVGKSGKLTPVAELEPVLLAGTTVSRASLHNFVELRRKDVRAGDVVLVEKAGEIIPQIVGVEHAQRPAGTVAFEPPTTCPSCAASVVSEDIFVFCPNP